MSMLTPQDIRREEALTLIKGTLNHKYISLTINDMEIKESLVRENSFVQCSVAFGENETLIISGHGTGILDAFYGAMLKTLSSKFSSLAEVKFVDFRVNAEGLSRYKVNPGSNAFVEAHLMTKGKKNKSVLFHTRSRSVNTATLNVACDAIEFYINCEAAFITLRKFLDDARKRNRSDLIRSVTNNIIKIVDINSYEEVLEGDTNIC